jgi:hypothetical protein
LYCYPSIFFARRDDFMPLKGWKLTAENLRAAHCGTSSACKRAELALSRFHAGRQISLASLRRVFGHEAEENRSATRMPLSSQSPEDDLRSSGQAKAYRTF